MPNISQTGRYLVLLHQDHPQEGIQALADTTGVRVTEAAAHKAGATVLPPECALVFSRIGVVLVRCAQDRQPALAGLAAAGSNILAIEAERFVHALPARYRPAKAAPSSTTAADTWGVQAVGAGQSSYTGKGIRIAILDTGFDFSHPDFAGREIVSRSFVQGEDAQDGNGHGTHCAGIAAGPRVPISGPRYGVAGEAQLYIGKVLGNEGGGGDGGVLEGINWAIENNCQVISMSLGSVTTPDQPYSRVFEEVARRAMAAGAVIIAAAGNDSERPDHIAPVAHPANCPSIIGVGAIDELRRVAPFSNGGLVSDGGKVDIAAPGVAVLSAWPGPQGYNSISGTSMATPFVAGVAALYAQAGAANRGKALVDVLKNNATKLDLPPRDVGAGLVAAPHKA